MSDTFTVEVPETPGMVYSVTQGAIRPPVREAIVLPTIQGLPWMGRDWQTAIDLWAEEGGILLQAGDEDGVVHVFLDDARARALVGQLTALLDAPKGEA